MSWSITRSSNVNATLNVALQRCEILAHSGLPRMINLRCEILWQRDLHGSCKPVPDLLEPSQYALSPGVSHALRDKFDGYELRQLEPWSGKTKQVTWGAQTAMIANALGQVWPLHCAQAFGGALSSGSTPPLCFANPWAWLHKACQSRIWLVHGHFGPAIWPFAQFQMTLPGSKAWLTTGLQMCEAEICDSIYKPG